MFTQPYFYLTDKIEEVLREQHKEDATKKLNAAEIARRIVENPKHREVCEKKLERSDNPDLKGHSFDSVKEKLIAQIRAEITAIKTRKKSNIEVDVLARPRLFYYVEESKQKTEKKQTTAHDVNLETYQKAQEEEKNEKSLYPKLQQYLYHSDYKVFSRHIPHQGTSGREAGADKWLHPDLVGLQDVQEDFENQETVSLMNNLSQKRFKFWSFEVKLKINRSNLREAFFQTVANSFWANFAYLVAAELSGSDTEKELRRLANLHGVGFIHLNSEHPPESDIIIPAKEREEVDWNMFYRLVESNNKFQKDYLEIANKIIDAKVPKKLNPDDWGIEIIKENQ